MNTFVHQFVLITQGETGAHILENRFFSSTCHTHTHTPNEMKCAPFHMQFLNYEIASNAITRFSLLFQCNYYYKFYYLLSSCVFFFSIYFMCALSIKAYRDVNDLFFICLSTVKKKKKNTVVNKQANRRQLHQTMNSPSQFTVSLA